MKRFRRTAIFAATLALAAAAPSKAASEYPLETSNYVEVSGIMIDDGHDLEYANHLAGQWRRGQDYAKQQGWIVSYEILQNVHKRMGEPDIYLITRFANFATKAEQDKRDDAYRTYMQRTETQMQAESGDRAKYRHLGSTELLRELVWAK